MQMVLAQWGKVQVLCHLNWVCLHQQVVCEDGEGVAFFGADQDCALHEIS